jgi:hypothetical protein
MSKYYNSIFFSKSFNVLPSKQEVPYHYKITDSNSDWLVMLANSCSLPQFQMNNYPQCHDPSLHSGDETTYSLSSDFKANVLTGV